jgi:hypothetical protein
METVQRMAPDGSSIAVLAYHRSTFSGGNRPSAITIGQDLLEVRLRRQQVQITVEPSTTRDGASPRVVSLKNRAGNEMTSAMLLKIGGISGVELHLHHNGF